MDFFYVANRWFSFWITAGDRFSLLRSTIGTIEQICWKNGGIKDLIGLVTARNRYGNLRAKNTNANEW